MYRYVSDELPIKPVNGWAKVSPSVGKENPEKKLIWGYVSAAYVLAVKLESYSEQHSEDNICTNYGCEMIPALFRLCKKAVSLAMTYYYDNHIVNGFKYPSFLTGWRTIQANLDLDEYPEELNALMELFDKTNENDLVRDGENKYVNYETLCGDTRRAVSLMLTRAV